jgi:hypothetical protein
MSQPFFFAFYLLGIIHLRFAEADEPERWCLKAIKSNACSDVATFLF